MTRRGWAVLGLVFLVALGGFTLGIYPFLAVNAPVQAKVLVVEGWAADYAVEAAAREFEARDYTMAYVTGGPMERGTPFSEYKTYAALGAAVLNHFGTPSNRIQAVAAPKVRRDRTYASALALKDWLEARGETPTALNVLTVGPHARRSRLLYQQAFGKGCQIGVMAVEPEDFDPDRWWAYSAGVRAILGETTAYLYARLLFRVSADRRAENETGEDSMKSSPDGSDSGTRQ